MNVLTWVLAEAAFPMALGGGVALAVGVARLPQPVRHYRWRNRRWLRTQVPLIELRARARRGGPEEETSGSRTPLVPAGGERAPRPLAALPPAPSALVGAVSPPAAAPTRPQVIRLGGGLP